MAAARSIKPTKIHLALEELDSENDAREPFTFTLPGDPKPITFIDPQNLPWQDLLNLENPYDLADLCIESEDDRRRFLENPLNGRNLAKLTQAFRAHYGMGTQGKSRGSAS